MRLGLNVRVVDFAVFQLAAVTLLVLLGTAAYLFTYFTGYDSVLGFLRLVDLGKELNLATYFSSLNLLLSSILLFVAYKFEKAAGSSSTRYWLFLSALFLVLSTDEAAGIHENFGRVYEYLSVRGAVPTLDSHKWLPFGILFTFLVGLGLIPFVRRLPRDTARLFLAAGFVFVLGAIGFELLGTWMLSSGFVESRQELPYLLRRVVEEGLEMYAIAMFNIAIYRELSRNEVSVLIDSSGGAT